MPDCTGSGPIEPDAGRFRTIQSGELHDVTAGALERALLLAAQAGRWELVEVLARELNRRQGGAGSNTDQAPTRTASTRTKSPSRS